MTRVGARARHRRLHPAGHAIVALDRAIARHERLIALVDVARQQVGAERIGAGHDHARHVEHVGGEPRRDERSLELRRGNEHLAAHVAALLFRGELILEVHAGGARLDHRFHELERVQRSTEPGLGVGDDRHEPLAFAVCPSAHST